MSGARCPECSFVAGSAAGLSSHRRSKHAGSGSNLRQLEVTLELLEERGWFEPVDAARLQMLRSLAGAVDDSPTNAPLWRQYREALGEVLRADHDASDDLSEAVAAIRGDAEVGDSTPS